MTENIFKNLNKEERIEVLSDLVRDEDIKGSSLDKAMKMIYFTAREEADLEAKRKQLGFNQTYTQVLNLYKGE